MTDHCLILAGKKGVMFKSGLWETEVLKCHEFFQARLQVKVKCAVLFSITGLFKFDRK